MGTNFYIKNQNKNSMVDDDPIWHIGKRSAAGGYCFDCDRTLCMGGPSKVHTGTNYYAVCPDCEKKNQEGACSFTFAMSFHSLYQRLREEFGKQFNENQKTIIDDCGAEFSYMEFLAKLNVVPISLRFTNMLGQQFS